jgi:hypothetical protein
MTRVIGVDSSDDSWAFVGRGPGRHMRVVGAKTDDATYWRGRHRTGTDPSQARGSVSVKLLSSPV